MKNQYLNQLYDTPGYISNLSLETNELSFFREAITLQWMLKIKEVSLDTFYKIKKNNISIENYHLISESINHESIWSKRSRVLDKVITYKFLKSSFFNKLENLFGNIIISDEEDLGYGNIYWRLVRPNKSNDVGPYHRDSWFWDLNKSFPKPDYPFTRIKIWISIYNELGKNGLLAEKNSHKRRDILWKGKFKDGIIKPILNDNQENFNMELIPTKAGDCIIFNDDLLHGGAINLGLKTRISVEFTILKKET